MRFWDSSALVPLVLREASSETMRRLYRADSDVLVWALTRTELRSALCRKEREGGLKGAPLATARRRVAALSQAWSEVIDLARVCARAERLIEVHPLSAADAHQLAAALIAVEEAPTGFGFLTLDDRLAEAARREGFSVGP